MSWKSRVVQLVTKATTEQELPHQQFRFGVLSFYRCHATMSLFFRQFVHETEIIFGMSYFTFQCPPLAGPMCSINPSFFRLARCFSIALTEIPIFSARAAALNLLSSARKTMILSLLFRVLPYFYFHL